MGSPFPANKAPGKHWKPSFWRTRKTLEKTIDHATLDHAFLLLCQNLYWKHQINFISKDCNATLLNLNSTFFFFFSKEGFKNILELSLMWNKSLHGAMAKYVQEFCTGWKCDAGISIATTILPKVHHASWFLWHDRSWLVFPSAGWSWRKTIPRRAACFGLIILSCRSATLLPKTDWLKGGVSGLGCWLSGDAGAEARLRSLKGLMGRPGQLEVGCPS